MPHKNKRTENYLRAAEFKRPEWIPCHVSIMPATWRKYREDVEGIVLRHPKIFPDYKRGDKNFDEILDPGYHEGEFTDSCSTWTVSSSPSRSPGISEGISWRR
ncbi:MAG: hypothetical protein ACUVXI_05965 [bacterium]